MSRSCGNQVMGLFKEKGIRVARKPMFDVSDLVAYRKPTTSESSDSDSGSEENCQKSGNRVYASGEVYIGNTLTKAEFKRLTKLQNEVGIHMILRQRPGIELQYTEAFIRSQYEAWAYFENLQDERRKVKTRTRARSSRRGTYWPAAPLLTERPVWCRPVTKRAGQWDVYLQDVDNLGHVAPVQFFNKAPLANIWDTVAKMGTFVEVRNPFVNPAQDVYTIGRIVYFAGYLALVQFSSESDSTSYLGWISFFSDVPKPLGWAALHGKRVTPVDCTEKDLSISTDFTGSSTISEDHVSELLGNIRSMCSVHQSLPVEVQDPENPDQVHLARVTAKAGNRVHLWCKNGPCHWTNSFLDVHPLGWSHTIGVQLAGESSFKMVPLDPEKLPKHIDGIDIQVGMELEARHPRLRYKIVAAQVVKVLNFQYFVVETREYHEATRVSFICHITSPFIFPCGWAQKWGINLDAEDNTEDEGPCLPLQKLQKRQAHHFKTGMKLETVVSLADGDQYVVPATVQDVYDHLILVHVDGTAYTEVNTKFVDVEYSDIYPAGYAELFGIKFRGMPGVLPGDDTFFNWTDTNGSELDSEAGAA